jgi:hypothetical protein
LTLADGGVFANNPTVVMSLDMHRRYPAVALNNYTCKWQRNNTPRKGGVLEKMAK